MVSRGKASKAWQSTPLSRFIPASDPGCDVARPGLFSLYIVCAFEQYHNGPDSLTSLILATNFLALAWLEALFLLSNNLGIRKGTRVPSKKVVIFGLPSFLS
jgi:hypothetical protein